MQDIFLLFIHKSLNLGKSLLWWLRAPVQGFTGGAKNAD
jgi:hypothetical protein